MKNKTCFLLLFIGFTCCFYGCKSSDPCSQFHKTYEIKAKDVPKVNNGYYFLCYLEEKPIIYVMDSTMENSFPWYLHGSSKYLENPQYLRMKNDLESPKYLKEEVISYVVIKLRIKPIDVYFTRYSYDDFRNLNIDIRNGKMPSKEPFLQFNTLYYVTCNSSDIKSFNKMYDKKELVLLDKKHPETKVDYFYSFNGYPANKIDFSKLYSFDEVVKGIKKER